MTALFNNACKYDSKSDWAQARLSRVCVYFDGFFFWIWAGGVVTAGCQAPCYLSQSPMELACCPAHLHPSIHPSMGFFFSHHLTLFLRFLDFHSTFEVACFPYIKTPRLPLSFSEHPNFFSLSDNSDHPIFCHLITPLPALCFSISSSSNTPLSVALQAADERTLLVMVEQRRSLDALDRPGPFVSVVSDAVLHGKTMPQGTTNIHLHQLWKQHRQRHSCLDS